MLPRASWSEIADNLWQGSAPSPELMKGVGCGFKVLVLCAEEYQPEPAHFPRQEVILSPNDDRASVPPSRAQIEQAVQSAKRVARFVASGTPVLVTCYLGLNRSGLVTALALHFLKGISGIEAIEKIQDKRGPRALSNPHLAEFLRGVKADKPWEKNLANVVSLPQKRSFPIRVR